MAARPLQRLASALALVVAGLVALAAPGIADAHLNAVPVVPHNGTAAIFDIFKDVNVPFLNGIEDKLKKEHYRVLEYSYRKGPSPFATVAAPTLPNFRTMAAKASVVVTISHGDVDNHAQLVEVKPSKAAMNSAYRSYVAQGYSKKDIFAFDFEETGTRLSGKDKGKPYSRPVYGIWVTRAGINHFFAKSPPTLVVNSACGAFPVAGEYHAVAYFGYSGREHKCSESLPDINKLFDRLTGAAGASNRTTVAAYNLGGYSPLLRRAGQAVVLSPAVTSVEPATAAPGTTTPGSVQFDAKMARRTNGIVDVSGCGASLSGEPEWDRTRTLLAFALKVPRTESSGRITIRVIASKARAAGGGGQNDWLDGNTKPRGKGSGYLPNTDSYVWHIPCEQRAFEIDVADSGTYDVTDALSGQVQEDVSLHWTATVALTFPTDGPVQRKPTIDVGGSVTFSGPDPSEDYSCNVTAIPASENSWTTGLVELGAQGGTYGVLGYPESDPLTIITGQTDPAPDVPGGSITLSGDSRCALDNSPTFFEQDVNTDSNADWLAAKTPFETSGQDLQTHGRLVKPYTVTDTLTNGNETKQIQLSRTITVIAIN